MAKGIIHRDLADKLRALIEDGDYAPHDPFMSLREIGRKFKVTPSTALNAVSHLARQGFLYVEHGKGSFVAPRISTRNILLVTDLGYLSGAMPMFRDGLREALDKAPEYVEVQESPERFIERLPELKFHYPDLDGIVFFRRIDTYLKSEPVLEKLGIPCVFYGLSTLASFLEGKNRRLVPQDRIVDTALTYLVKKGHKNIGLVQRINPSDHDNRHTLFLQWMCDHDLAVRKSNIMTVERTPDEKFALNYTLNGYSKATDATALFCTDDLTAQRAMNSLVKKGVRIPQDIAIVGVNNYPFCEETITPLSSIDIPWVEDGKAVGRQLLSLIKKPDQVIQTESTVTLVERFSTRTKR
jgi:DNA-binding LacI/PurR family transcriptional regulator